MNKKTLKYIIIGVSIYVAVIVIEFCCLYTVYANDILNYLKEFWNWYVMQKRILQLCFVRLQKFFK